MIERQESHLIHKPSVRTRRSSMGVELSIRFLSRLNQAMLVVDSPLREDSFRVRMLDLAHFGDEIGQLDELRMRVASGANHVHALGPPGQRFDDFLRIQHFIRNYVIDLIEYY